MGLVKRLMGEREQRRPAKMQAVWRNTVLAASSNTISVDGKRYFPPDDVKWEYLRPSDKETVCLWKGRAGYYDVEIDGQRNPAAAWVYPNPQPAAAELKDHVAFWKGVKVRSVDDA